MKDSKKEYDIIKLTLGHLEAHKVDELNREITGSKDLKSILREYDTLTDDLERLPITQVPKEVSMRFEGWLQEEIRKDTLEVSKTWTIIRVMKYGVAASLLILVGLFLGEYFKNDESQLVASSLQQQELLQLISTESATNRIKGINGSYSLQKMDGEIGEAFVRLLSEDQSINVRLAVVDALRQYSSESLVKEGLLRALETEQQPIVQISIINALVGMNEPRVRLKLEELIQKEEVQSFVKDEARLGLTRL